MKLEGKSHKIMLMLAGNLASMALRLLAKSLRVKYAGTFDIGKPCIYALWHNRQLMCISLHRDCGALTLASASRDGDYIAAILDKLGFLVARGSTDTNKGNYKKSLSAARSLLRGLKKGKSIAVTVDGPLGPKYTVHEGVIFLAKATGCPVIPVGTASAPAIKLKTWDNLEIPIPFSRAAVLYGEPYQIGRDADQAEEAEKLRQKLAILTEEAEKMAK